MDSELNTLERQHFGTCSDQILLQKDTIAGYRGPLAITREEATNNDDIHLFRYSFNSSAMKSRTTSNSNSTKLLNQCIGLHQFVGKRVCLGLEFCIFFQKVLHLGQSRLLRIKFSNTRLNLLFGGEPPTSEEEYPYRELGHVPQNSD